MEVLRETAVLFMTVISLLQLLPLCSPVLLMTKDREKEDLPLFHSANPNHLPYCRLFVSSGSRGASVVTVVSMASGAEILVRDWL